MAEQKTAEIPELLQRKSKKNVFFKVLFLLINVFVIAILLYKEMNGRSFAQLATSLNTEYRKNYGWLFAVAGLSAAIVLLDGLGFFLLAAKTTKKRLLGVGVGTAIVGRYGDGITPLGTGGQPFQMYYLKKRGLPFELACAMPLMKYIVKIFATDIIMLVFMLTGKFEIAPIIKIAAIVGLALNTVAPTALLIFAVNKSFCAKTLNFFLRLGSKLRLVKNQEAQLLKWQKPIEDFSVAMKLLSKSPLQIIELAVLSSAEFLATLALPYCVCMALGFNANFVMVATLAVYVQNASSFIPTPGASGVTELTFYSLFAAIVSGELVFSAMLLWRFAGFYIYVLVGLLLVSFMKKRELNIDNTLFNKEVDDEN